MSKAFTRESEDAPELPVLPRAPAILPPGTKNYLTPGGARRLQEELERLVQVDRPKVAALQNEGADKHRLQPLDQRIFHLQQSLHSAEIVPPPAPPHDQVRFGATVSVRDARGGEARYRIVGIDEVDLDRGWVSWRSPMARALLNARIGQRVRLRVPEGEDELEIVGINYE